MSTRIDRKLEQARRQLIKHGRSWTIYDEELNDEENEFISEAPDLLSDALAEVDRLRAECQRLHNRSVHPSWAKVTDDMVERAARGISAHWHDMTTNGSLDRERALARAALEAALNTKEN